MERFVLEYQQSDGCTYSCTNTLPVQYSSGEALLVDLETAMRKGVDDQVSEVKFAGYDFYPPDFFYVDTRTQATVFSGPKILTIDEWFAENG
jgi:hypothetical protein